MNNTTVIDLRQFVEARNGEARTDSMKVAEAFGKQHKDVLRKLDTIECSADFRERNFTLTQETIMAGAVQRKSPLCEMTKDGFIFLVMGFTGKKAAQVKEAYISAFNWMADQLGLGQPSSVSIGTHGAKMIAAVKRGKVACLPKKYQRKALAVIGKQLNVAFGVRSAMDIPADQLDAARNFIAAYAISGEYLSKQEGIKTEGNPFSRYLVSFDHKGEQQITPVPRDACVMTVPQMIRAMLTPGDLPVSSEEMFEFAQAALTNLKMRSDCQTHQLRKARAAA